MIFLQFHVLSFLVHRLMSRHCLLAVRLVIAVLALDVSLALNQMHSFHVSTNVLERFVAIFTHKLLRVRVTSQVCQKLRFYREISLAKIATKRHVVSLHVQIQIALGFEHFSANCACFVFNALVSIFDVIIQAFGCVELVTNLAFDLFGVRLSMLNQGELAEEAFVALIAVER